MWRDVFGRSQQTDPIESLDEFARMQQRGLAQQLGGLGQQQNSPTLVQENCMLRDEVLAHKKEINMLRQALFQMEGQALSYKTKTKELESRPSGSKEEQRLRKHNKKLMERIAYYEKKE